MAEGSPTGRDKILGAISLGNAALHAFNTAIEQISKLAGPNGETLPLSSVVPGFPEQITFLTISEQLSGTIELLRSLGGIHSTRLIPENDISELTSRVGELKTTADRLSSSIVEFLSGGPVTGIDASSIAATNGSGQRLEVATLVGASYRPIQGVLASVRRLLPDRIDTETAPLIATAEELARVRASQQSAAGEIAATQRTVSKVQKTIQQIADEAQKRLEAINQVSEQVPSYQEKLTSNLQDATALLQKITSVEAQAKALQQTVTAYQAEFDRFGVALEGREKAIQDGGQAFEKMLKDNAAGAEELNRIVARARSVLGEATVAGLSDRFAKQAKSLGKSLLWAQGFFLFGVALLFFQLVWRSISSRGWPGVCTLSSELRPSAIVDGQILFIWLPA